MTSGDNASIILIWIETKEAVVKKMVSLLEMAQKNKAAVSLGKMRAALAAPGEMAEMGRAGGAIGGKARAKSLTPKRRKEIAQKAAAARWGSSTSSKPKTGDS